MTLAISKKLSVLGMSGMMMMSLPACTDNQIAASALVIGAAIICDTDCGGHHHHRRHGRGYPRHHRHGHRWAATVEGLGTLPKSDFVSTDERVVKVSNRYEIPHYAATYIVRAIVMAEAKNTQGIQELGLEVKDFKKIFDGGKLAADKVDVLGNKLLLEKSETERLVGEMSEDIQVEKAFRRL